MKTIILGLFTCLGLAATESFATISLSRVATQAVENRINLPSPWDNERETRSFPRRFIINTISDGKHHLYAFYGVDSDRGDLDLVAIERRDPSNRELIAFRHRYVFAGETRWTSWLPSALRKQGHYSWPNLDADPDLDTVTSVPDTHRINREWSRLLPRISELADLSQGQEDAAFDFAPGQYEWSYDPALTQIWAGYLWDFQNGWLFRGYRTPSLPGEILTPSQNQDSSDQAKIRAYYFAADPGSIADFSAENSRWLSPLDKWGIWANRRYGQLWWLPSAWEGFNHYKNMAWGGYCNSSTVLPYLWKKPRHSVIDQNLTFDPRDLVGILQVASYKVDYLFWGHRYTGAPGQDISYPPPQLAIPLLKEYVGRQRIPLIFNHEAGPAVGNVLAVKVHLSIQPTQDPLVRTGLLAIEDTGNMEDDLAKATKTEVAQVPDWTWGTNTKKYGFRIHLNPDGSVRTTEWERPDFHPSFFWLPTGLGEDAAPYTRNPHLPIPYVKELINRSY